MGDSERWNTRSRKRQKNVSKRNANVGVRTGLQQQYHGKEVLMPTPREGGLHRWASMRGGPFPVVTQGSTGGSLFRGLALVKNGGGRTRGPASAAHIMRMIIVQRRNGPT